MILYDYIGIKINIIQDRIIIILLLYSFSLILKEIKIKVFVWALVTVSTEPNEDLVLAEYSLTLWIFTIYLTVFQLKRF